MATQYDPIAKDESLNTTEVTPRNIADVLAEGLKGIEDALPTYTEGDGIDISAQKVISVDTTFTEASTRANIASGDSFSTILGKIKKFFTDLKSVAFSGAAADVTYGSGSVEDALDALTNYSYGTYVDLSGTSSSSPYTAPSDGILLVDYPYSTTGYIYVNVNGLQLHSSKMHSGAAYTWTLPVKKGMSIYKDQSSVANPAILFVPYV